MNDKLAFLVVNAKQMAALGQGEKCVCIHKGTEGLVLAFQRGHLEETSWRTPQERVEGAWGCLGETHSWQTGQQA